MAYSELREYPLERLIALRDAAQRRVARCYDALESAQELAEEIDAELTSRDLRVDQSR